MLDTKGYKEIRLSKTYGKEVSPSIYNLIIGATLLFGIAINIAMAVFMQDTVTRMNIIAVILIYFIGSIACTVIIYKNDNPAVSFIGFTGLSICMGLLVTYVLSYYDLGTVTYAFGMTGLVTLLMMLLATAFPRFFIGLGRVLFISLLAAVIIEVIFRMLLRFDLSIMDYAVALIFSGYIGYDWSRAQAYPKTVDNAIDSSADIFVDIVGLFLRILSITGDRD